MNLRLVTITGIDERTDLQELALLSERFPWVEWGVLLSLSRQGQQPRYPSIQFLRGLEGRPIRTAVHICGRQARDAADARDFALEAALYLVPGAGRIQVNAGATLNDHGFVFHSLRHAAYRVNRQIIIQTPTFDNKIVEGAASHPVPPPINCAGHDTCVFLLDASGGQGIHAHFERPNSSRFVGFAGGIGPANVENTLHRIDALNFDAPFWIDMESGVRDSDDWLDLAKVEEVLRLAEPYIWKGPAE